MMMRRGILMTIMLLILLHEPVEVHAKYSIPEEVKRCLKACFRKLLQTVIIDRKDWLSLFMDCLDICEAYLHSSDNFSRPEPDVVPNLYIDKNG